MKIHPIFFCATLLTCISGYANHTSLDTIAKKVVFIIVDGVSANQLKTAYTPYLDSIGAIGGYSDAYVGGAKGTYSETPTISAVGYNSLLTGTWANKHNVYGNGIKAPNYNYPTIFRLFKDHNPKGTIGVFSSWLDNRTKLVGEGLKETEHLKVDYAFDGLEHDSVNYPHDNKRNFMKLIDLNVALHASETILKKGPDVSWVYLEFTDDMGHAYGDSPQLSAAITFEDGLVGRIYNAITERQKTYDEDWLLIVTTDHGRKENDGKGHGGQSEGERSTWIVTNAKNTNTYFKNNTPAVVDILPTMTYFLDMEVPVEVKREWDGVSLIRPVDATDLRVKKEEGNLVLTWKARSKASGKIFVSTGNFFKSGGTDQYEFIKSVSLEKEEEIIPFTNIPGGFCKLVLETPNTMLNTWLPEK